MTHFPRAAVLGNPISHSLSPKLHGFWLRRYGLAGEYTAIKVEDSDLETTLLDLPRQGFIGVNVTLPHKVSVLKFADQVTDRATLIGAANTLTFKDDGKIIADNTDGYGFMSNLHQNAPDWDPKAGAAAILGAGGACRAIIVALANAGVPKILLANRTRAKAEALRDEFGSRIAVVDWINVEDMIAEAKTVINTTSLGMSGGPAFKLTLAGLQSDAIATDIVYNPLRTPFLQAAEARGCRTVDGLGMLLHQGVPGFERWFGKRPEVDDETRAAVLA